MNRDTVALLLRTWFVTAVIDGLFSSLLNVYAYGSTVSQLWQRVASVLLGPAALDGGTRTVLIGLLMHAGVALHWSSVFLALVMSWPWLQRAIFTWGGKLAVAAVYGPLVWMVMSFAVVPALTGRPPTVTARWWTQFFGHMLFVGLPIVAMIGRRTGIAIRSGAARTVGEPL